MDEKIDVLEGFTKKIKEYLKEKPTKDKIDASNIIYMPTYQFAILALNHNDPDRVINVISIIKKRYRFRFNLTKEASGFLDSLEAKCYGYLALNSKNSSDREKYYKLAIKYFNNAKNKGYIKGYLDLAYLEKMYTSAYSGEKIAFEVYHETKLVHLIRGEMFFGFERLVDNAIRVIEGKRPIIDDFDAFKYAMEAYKSGKDDSISCMFYYALCLVIYKNGILKDMGLSLIKKHYSNFKKEREEFNRALFLSDKQDIEEKLKLIENKLLNIKIR